MNMTPTQIVVGTRLIAELFPIKDDFSGNRVRLSFILNANKSLEDNMILIKTYLEELLYGG